MQVTKIWFSGYQKWLRADAGARVPLKNTGVSVGYRISMTAQLALRNQVGYGDGAVFLEQELGHRFADGLRAAGRVCGQAMIDKSQEYVTGSVRMKLYEGNATVAGRTSPYSLYRQDYVSFEKDSVYNQKGAEGFIKLNALRLRLLAARHQTLKRLGLMLSNAWRNAHDR